jgi:hypothetical protein
MRVESKGCCAPQMEYFYSSRRYITACTTNVCLRHGFTGPSRTHSDHVRRVTEYNAAHGMKPASRINKACALDSGRRPPCAWSCERSTPEGASRLAPPTRIDDTCRPRAARTLQCETDTGEKEISRPGVICAGPA